MADPITSSQQPREATSSTTTVTIDATDSQHQGVPTVHLKLVKPRNDRKVQWTTETVDNEDMDKKKSKCCCIYKKPKAFDESSSSSDSSDDECDTCKGHVEKKKTHQHHHHDHEHNHGTTAEPSEDTKTVVADKTGEPTETSQHNML